MATINSKRPSALTPAKEIFWRTVAAIPVAYVATNLVAVALGILMPVARADAAQIGLLSSFLVYAAIVIRIFSPVALKRMWLELIGVTVVAGVVVAGGYFSGALL